MLLCKKIKVEISAKDAVTLEFMQGKCRGLYNWWIGKLRDKEKWNVYQAKKTLAESRKHDPEIDKVYGKLLHEVYFRLNDAMQAFFKRVSEKADKPGFPRFKPRHQFFTLKYPAMYLKLEGRKLTLPTGGNGKLKQYRNIVALLTEDAPRNFKEVSISRDARNNYFASFAYASDVLESKINGVLAIDLGIKTLACCVNQDRHFYHIGGFRGYKWYNRQLDSIRSKRDKCKKGSSEYIRLSQVYKRVSEKKRNKLKDCLHKASHLIVYKLAGSAVVIGDLSQRQMVQKSDNRKLNRTVFNDWGLYDFVRMLKYKTKLQGKELHEISERNTSKECNACKHIQDMPLWKRTYKCEKCGFKIDRDENSALNILERFLARLGPYGDENPCGVPE